MKKCPKCGTINQDDYKYCEACACKLEENEPKQRSTHLKGSLGSVRYTGASIPNEDDIKSHREHAASSQFKGRIGDKTYTFDSEKTDTPSVRRKFQFDTGKSSESKESRGEFVGRMGKTEYRRMDDSPEIIKRQNNSYKFDGSESVKSSKKFNRTWVAGAFAAIVVMAIAIPSAIHISSRDKEVPTSITAPNTSALAYQQFGAELSDLINQYGISSEQDEYSSCRLLVSCDDSVDISSLGATEILQSPDGVYVLQYENRTDAEEACNNLSSMQGVKYAEPDVWVSADTTGITAADPISWGTPAVGADLFANQLSRKNYNRVTVAIVDSGVYEHEFLRGRLRDGWDFIGNDADPTDEYFHGTHVAGIVVDSTQGLDIDLLPVRVLDERGYGSSSLVGSGIRYATDCGADVINLSLGGGHSSYIDDAVSYALSRGVIVVVSAGNDSTQTSEQCPAHIDDCITVSAVNQDLVLADFSNYGGAVDFCAPGVGIYSSVLNNKYDYLNGTSMSTPYISALAAMLKASGMASSVHEVETLLASCSLDLGASGRDSDYGYGLPQVDKLLSGAEPTPSPKPTAVPAKSFADTYWTLVTGYGIGTFYELVFLADGTYDAYSHSGKYTSGTYSYDEESDILYIDGYAYLADGGEYKSLELFLFMGGPGEGENRKLVPSTRAEYVTYKELLESIPTSTPVPTNTPTIDLGSSLNDGEFKVRLYDDSFYKVEGYLCAEAALREPICLSHDYVYSLDVGDSLELSEYGSADILIESISYEDNCIRITEEGSPLGYTLYYSNESGEWNIAQNAGSGAFLEYTISIEDLVFSPDVYSTEVINDEYRELDSPDDARFEVCGGWLDAHIIIEGGIVTDVHYSVYG